MRRERRQGRARINVDSREIGMPKIADMVVVEEAVLLLLSIEV